MHTRGERLHLLLRGAHRRRRALPLPARARGSWRTRLARLARDGFASARTLRRGGGAGRARRSAWPAAYAAGLHPRRPRGRRWPSAWSRVDAGAQRGSARRWAHVLDTGGPARAHVAKWLLSVGDAVATGDFDGDGRLGPVPHPSAARAPRTARRSTATSATSASSACRCPRWTRSAALPRSTASLAAALFVDYDGDGDQDLVLGGRLRPVAPAAQPAARDGRRRLRGRRPRERAWTSTPVSLAATFLDFDRDGHLDLFVANAMTPRLPRLRSRRAPLNIFRLPAAGVRRATAACSASCTTAGTTRTTAASTSSTATWAAAASRRWTSAAHGHAGDALVACRRHRRPEPRRLDGPLRRQRLRPRRPLPQRGGAGASAASPAGCSATIGQDTYKGMNATVADFDRNGWLGRLRLQRAPARCRPRAACCG